MSSSTSTTSFSISNTTPSSSSPNHQPLTDLSPNTTSPRKRNNDTTDPFKSSPSATNEKPNTTTTNSNDQAAITSYISPSDAMLSPTTKKLSEIKGRRFASAKTGQTGSRALFQKAVMQGKENGGSAKSQSQQSL